LSDGVKFLPRTHVVCGFGRNLTRKGVGKT